MSRRTTGKPERGVFLPLELSQPTSALAPRVLRACVEDAIEADKGRARARRPEMIAASPLSKLADRLEEMFAIGRPR